MSLPEDIPIPDCSDTPVAGDVTYIETRAPSLWARLRTPCSPETRRCSTPAVRAVGRGGIPGPQVTGCPLPGMLCARREGPGPQVSPVSLLPTAPNSALPPMPAACWRWPPPPTARCPAQSRPETRGPARGSAGAETQWAVRAGHAWLTCLRKCGPADTCAAFGPLSRALRCVEKAPGGAAVLCEGGEATCGARVDGT